MARNIFGEIRQIIEEQTSKIGSVSNLHGISDVPDVQIQEPKDQQWFVAQLDITRMPSLFEALDRLTYERPAVETINSNNTGTAYWPQDSSRTNNKAVFFMTLARVPSNMKVPFQVISEGANLDLYVDGIRLAAGVDRISAQVGLAAGDHVVQVIAQGGSKQVSVAVAKHVECVRADITPEPPIWKGSPEVFELDAARADIVVRLTWRNDALATAWQVYRAQALSIGTIDTVTDNSDGTFTIKLYGAFDLEEGHTLYTKYWPLGEILNITESSDGGGEFVEYIIARHEDSSALTVDWDGLEVLVEGDYSGLVGVNYAGHQEITWDDKAIIPDTTYLYKLTAFGLFNSTESDFSTPALVHTNDEVAPQGIDWDVAYPPLIEVKGDQIHVDYVSPDDPDFEGVHVYGPYALTVGNELIVPVAFAPNERVFTAFGEPNGTGERKRDQFNFTAIKDGLGEYIEGGYFFATFDALGNEQLPDDSYGYVFEGTIDSVVPASNVSIEFDVNPVSDLEDHLIIHVYPVDDELGSPVQFTGFVNGVEVNAGTTPALTQTLPPAAEYRIYEITLTRLEGEDLRFIGTANGSGLRPMTMSYFMDEDPFAGLSGVHVEDRKANPVVYAVMDDDAQYVRILEAPYNPASDVLFTATKTSGTDIPGTIDYNTAVMIYTHPTALDVDEVVSLRIDASKDGSAWTTDLWRGAIQGPAASTSQKSPVISVENFAWTGTPQFGQYPSFTVTLRATNPNAATARVRLKWQALGDNLAWSAISTISGSSGTVTSAVGSNTVTRTLTFNRFTSAADDRTIRIYAETIEGEFLNTEITYTADFDTNPEVVSAAAYPNPTSGQQTGWRIIGSVDDDTDTIIFTAGDVNGATPGSHGIAGLPSNQNAGSGGSKVFDFTVTQSAGRIGNLIITPRKNGVTGAPYTLPLKRSPVTSIRIEEVDAVTVAAILTSTPSNATKYIRSYLVGSAAPAFEEYTVPVEYSRNPTTDRIIEYYSVSNGLVEEIQSVTVDTDDIAELGAWTATRDGNVVTVTVYPDDDCAGWLCYAKKGEDPGNDADYLRFEGTKNNRSISFYVTGNADGSTATWYVRVAGISWAGDMNLHDAVTITGVPGTPGSPPPASGGATAKFNSGWVSVQRSSGTNIVHWTTNASGAGSNVTIDWFNTLGESGQFSAQTLAANSDGVAVGTYEHTGLNFGQAPFGEWHTFTYILTIVGTTSTYYVEYSDYYY